MQKVDTQGGCLCGAIRYSVKGNVQGSASCHCRDCQYVCGGAPSYVLVVARKSLEILQGEPATFVNTADSGATRTRHFCPNCGTPLFAENSAFPDGISIKAGTLDDPSIYSVQAQFWTDSAPSWQPIDEKVPKFPKGPNSA